ncbi:MAG TPA: NUMOD4 motif-containing HNH endonuclease [Urbifossiella sp.]|nr:NUMOD4 motif-containing HNH endonuclease [Urbifossiella sp.]
MSDDEQWQEIPGYPGYAASDLGRIKNLKRDAVLSGTLTKEGYIQVCLRKVDRRTVAYAHRLVAFAFLGPAPDGFVVNHKNAVKTDCRLCNLEWVSVRDNIRHAASLGLLRAGRLVGEENPNVKLTENEVRQMRAQRQSGVTLAALGRQYGVTAATAHLVVTGKTWRHVGVEGDADSAPADAVSAVEVSSPTNPAPREWLELDGDELAVSL